MGSALRGPRQKDYCRFKASLGYTVSHRPDYKARPDLKKKKKNQINNNNNNRN